MAEQQIEHRKSCLVLSARFPVVNWRSSPVAKSAKYIVALPYTHTRKSTKTFLTFEADPQVLAQENKRNVDLL